MIQARTKRTTGNKALAFGLLLAALAATMVFTADPARAATFNVNSTGDSGDNNPGNGTCATQPFPVGTEPECTLRAAIEETNANNNDATVVDEIHFDIPGAGPHTISPSTVLQIITEPVVIDGYTQDDATENTLAVGDNADLRIRLDGSNAGFAAGLNITADDSVVRGLSITSFFTALAISGTDDNEIEGNFIGTDPGGTQALGSDNTLFIGNGASGNTVGGTTPAARNIISGNDFGVIVTGAGTTANKVQGNYIGTTKSGTGDLGNGNWGVIVDDGASNNMVGGKSREAANVIAFNGASPGASPNVDGVAISDNAGTGNIILSNSIFSNSDLGIDLGGGSGATPNDPGDTDTGPNNLQNFPVLDSARTSGGKTTIRSKLNSTPNGNFLVQFFSNPKGADEGRILLGQKNVDTNASGDASFAFAPAGTASGGQAITATATNGGGDTSEFSAAVAVDGPPAITPLSPRPGFRTRDTTPTIRAKVTDGETNLSKSNIKLFVDGKRKTNFAYDRSTDRLSFTARNLSFKRHTVRIIATDAVGNVAIRTWSFRVVRR